MRRLLVVLLVLVALAVALPACQKTEEPRLTVITSTSLLGDIVRQVGGKTVAVSDLVPASQHPGNFDLKPADIQKLAGADLLLLHGFPGETWAERLVTSANNPALVVEKVFVPGNGMIPSVRLLVTDKVVAALGKVDAANAEAYRKAGDEYKTRITAREANVKAKLSKAPLSGGVAASSDRQADFLQWAGIKVVATYGEPVTLTPQAVKDLVDKGKAGGVTIVVDNLQSGAEAGRGIAEELGATRIVLSNFPGGLTGTDTWEKAIDRNVDILIEAISKRK